MSRRRDDDTLTMQTSEAREQPVASGTPTLAQSDALKLVAVLAMTIDHIGAVLVPNLIILRMIGRIAFPLFAYQLAVGYVHTHDVRRYALRLALWGLVSQPVYMLAVGVGPWTLNIFATLLLGLAAIWGWDHGKWWAVGGALALAAVQIRFPGFGPDYGVYGILLCLVSYVLLSSPSSVAAAHAVLHVLAGIFLWPAQAAALLSVPLILRPPRLRVPHVPMLFYAYYPAHLLLLAGIHRMLVH